MTIKNILVAFNGSHSSAAALRSALLMHRKHGCHVTGLLAHAGQREVHSTQNWVPENVRQTIAARIAEKEKELEAQFRGIVADAVPADKLHWITLFGQSDATVARYSRLYDLTLVGRNDAVNERAEIELHPDRIALKSGRPILVIPGDYAAERIREVAVIAWDGLRTVARTVMDAMHLLESKQKVHVLSIDNGSLRPALQGIDIETSLRRHGIDVVRVSRPAHRANAATDILAYCDEVDAGLLVMGAYEHSVFRERLIGGTTQQILTQASLPIFMSH